MQRFIQKWQIEEVKLLADNLHLSTKEIYFKYCDIYGSNARTYDSIQKKVKKLREAYSEEPEDSELEEALEGFQETVDSLGQVLTDTQPSELIITDANSLRKRELKEEAKWWLDGIIERSSQITFPPSRSFNGNKTTLCSLISDLHIGKHNNHYNMELARQRLISIPEKIYNQGLKDNIDEVLIMLVGDLVEGEDIFRTQAHHIECSAIEQIQVATDSLWAMIQNFRAMFNCTVRVETVPGNHGRMSKTANEKTNWDNVIYHILRVAAANQNDKSIIVNANFDFFKTFQVKDKVGMLYHYGVKHTGTPAMREKVAGWSVRKQFDFMCHGHFHEWHVGNWLSKVVVANGCLCGPDDLAERMAVEDTARQAYFYVTPKLPLHGFSVVEWPEL